jgi:hypothetical protein
VRRWRHHQQSERIAVGILAAALLAGGCRGPADDVAPIASGPSLASSTGELAEADDLSPRPQGTELTDDEAGRAFQDAVLQAGSVSFEGYEAAMAAAVACVRAGGFEVTYPAEEEVRMVDPAIPPGAILGFDAHIEPGGPSAADLILECQERWSFRVQDAWLQQLEPSAEDRLRATEAAWACGEERGQALSDPPTIQEAHEAIVRYDCQPWEVIAEGP